MKTAIYPGTFDPITNGHVYIIERALKIFDQVIVAVAYSSPKKTLFTEKERVEIIKESLKHYDNVEVESFKGLLVDYARSKECSVIVRGLRVISDFDFEFQQALINRKLDENIETVFIMTNEQNSFLSSSIVKEVARLEGKIADLVPKAVNEAVKEKFK